MDLGLPIHFKIWTTRGKTVSQSMILRTSVETIRQLFIVIKSTDSFNSNV